MKKARVIAFYLPQYHPIKENNEWWGAGFTEWTNVAKAKPLFKGHVQPHIPADLGFYDLRLPEVREQQAQMAREAGIEGFCYWEYWFEKGKQLLERPFEEVLASGKPDFPFCLGWANDSWTNKTWKASNSKVKSEWLMEQKYSIDDYIAHFNHLLPAFKDSRYITVDGKPIYVVFKPLNIPNPKEFIDLWNKLAIENGLKGIHFVGLSYNFSFRNGTSHKIELHNTNNAAAIYENILNQGFDAINSRGTFRAETILDGMAKKAMILCLERFLHIDIIKKYSQKKINNLLYTPEDKWDNVYPTIIPNWDRSPRSGKKAVIYTGSTPEAFRQQLNLVLSLLEKKPFEHRIVFAQSWNEWGEGNYLEPDLQYGHQFLDILKEML